MPSGSNGTSDQPQNLESIIDTIEDFTEGESSASVDDLLGAFGSRSFGPLLVAPAVLMISPIGAIPGAPAVFNVFIILVCVQYIGGLKSPWLPSALRERAVPRDKVAAALDRVRPWARRVDSLLEPRLTFLVAPPVDRVLAVVATLLSASIFVIGLVPFAAAVPSSGIALIGLSVATRDGLMALLALASVGGTIWLGLSVVG